MITPRTCLKLIQNTTVLLWAHKILEKAHLARNLSPMLTFLYLFEADAHTQSMRSLERRKEADRLPFCIQMCMQAQVWI